MMRATPILVFALACLPLLAHAQSAGEKKADLGKAKDATKSKSVDSIPDFGKDPAKSKIPLELLKSPAGAIIVVVEELRDAFALFPKMVLLTPDEHKRLTDQIDILKQQLKAGKKVPSSCKLTGKLDGNFLQVRAEFAFSTEKAQTFVFLGLKGGHLTDEGELDGEPALLDVADDGFSTRVEKEGRHLLAVNLRVPVQVRKSATGTVERGIDLDLPGSAVTLLGLELPANVNELRWNDTLEKTRTPGRWQLALGKTKSLNLVWKELVSLAGNSALPKVENQVQVRVDETHINMTAVLTLEDSRSQTDVWRLLLPPSAKIDVRDPVGLTHTWKLPDAKTPYHEMKVSAPSAEPWQVTVLVRVPRPNLGQRVPIGPFCVLNTFQQQGAINVSIPADVSFGQRAIFTRNGDVFQIKNSDAESAFQYSAPMVSDKNIKAMQTLKAPVELEWRLDKNQFESNVEHAIKMRAAGTTWEMESTTRIHLKAVYSAINAVDLKLPMTRQRDLGSMVTPAFNQPFPGVLPWAGLWLAYQPTLVQTEEPEITDDQKTPLQFNTLDTIGNARVIWPRGQAKQITIVIKSVTRLPILTRATRVELPRPVNTRDGGTKLTLQTDDGIEILYGPAGAEEPVPQRSQFDSEWKQSPASFDFAWRSFEPETVTQAILDVTLHDRTAQVTQTLRLPALRKNTRADLRTGQFALRMPEGVTNVEVIAGAELLNQDTVRRQISLSVPRDADDRAEVKLRYDLPFKTAPRSEDGVPTTLKVSALWPTVVAVKDLKVRVWSLAGLKPRLAEETRERGIWNERGIEIVAGNDQVPMMVLQGYGADLPLTLEMDRAGMGRSTSLVIDRALAEVRFNSDGSQFCRMRYWIRKVHVAFIDVELPAPQSRLLEPPSFKLGKLTLSAIALDATEKIVRLNLPPDAFPGKGLFEISYTIPASAVEKAGLVLTTLPSPIIQGDPAIGQTRWQLTTATPMIAATFGSRVRPDIHWTMQGWLLTPEPNLTSADAEHWLTGVDPEQPGDLVVMSFMQTTATPMLVLHMPRAAWLLSCSGMFVLIVLGAYAAPISRLTFWTILLAIAVLGLSFAFRFPGFIPALLFGIQPGVVVVGLFAGFHWVMQERYRRHLLFLPGFSRGKQGSTMSRPNTAKRPREASTLDAPAAAAPDKAPSKSSKTPSSA